MTGSDAVVKAALKDWQPSPEVIERIAGVVKAYREQGVATAA